MRLVYGTVPLADLTSAVAAERKAASGWVQTAADVALSVGNGLRQ
jgi:hypothetical protein